MVLYIGNHTSSSKGYAAMGRQIVKNGGNTFAMFILSLIIIIMILLPQYHEQQSNTIEWQQEVLSRTKNLK